MPSPLSTQTLPVDKRILLHIMEYSRFENQFEVPFAISQEGIAIAIGIRRDNVPRAMKDLRTAGLVTEKVARVEGVYRKRKIYFLTNQGLRTIQELKTKILSDEVLLKFEDGHIEPVKVSEVNIKAKLHTRLGLIEILNNISSEGVLDVKTMVEQLEKPAQVQGQVKTTSGDAAQKSKFFEYIEDSPQPRNFVGRTKELTKIKTWLLDENYKIVVIYGIPGIGKTTLASKIMNIFHGKKHIFWYRFHRWDTMRNTFLVFADFLSKPIENG